MIIWKGFLRLIAYPADFYRSGRLYVKKIHRVCGLGLEWIAFFFHAVWYGRERDTVRTRGPRGASQMLTELHLIL